MDTKSKLDIADVTRGIVWGEFDDHIETLISTLVTRRNSVRDAETADIRSKLKVGTRIYTKGLSPKYLNHYSGVVTGFDGKWVICDLSENGAFIRRYSTKNLKVPAGCIKIAP